MAVENLGKCISLPASGDLSAKQFQFVKLDANGEVVAAGNGEDAIGILQNKPAAQGRSCTVMIGDGISKLKSGAAGTNGYPVASDTNGKGVDATTGKVVLGQWMEAPTAADEICTFLYKKRGADA